VKSTTKEEPMADETDLELSGVPDEIAGEPGAMGTFILRGPGVELYKFDGTAKLTSGMPEGQAYAVKDESASRRLATFVQSTATGFNSYSSSAETHGRDYLQTDELAANGIRHFGNLTQQFVAGD
jgi:hypothetical protein